MCVILFVVPFKVHFAHISWTLFQPHILTSIFVQLFCVRNIILRLYRAAHECGHFQVPMPETQDHKCSKNQSFNDQLNSIQILEQLAPLQLAKEHLSGDIVDILKRLGKVDNIFFNQHYYIAENCADHYYSKVIKTFVALLKCQFMDRQLLLVNTAGNLKFLEEYMDRQALIWKIFQKHKNIPDNIQDLHFHIDDFKPILKKNSHSSKKPHTRT